MKELNIQEAVGVADWITAGIICGIVILVALICILFIRWHDRRKLSYPHQAPREAGPDAVFLQRKQRVAALAEVREAKATPAQKMEPVQAQSQPAQPEPETLKKPEAPPEKPPVPAKTPQDVVAKGEVMEKKIEPKAPVLTPAPKSEPAAKPVTEVKAAGNAFDIFTSSNVEESAIGKMAAKLEDVSLDELAGDAQDIMMKLKGFK